MLRIVSVVVSGSLFVSMASIAHQSHRRFRLTPINALAKAASNPAADVNVALNKPVTLNGLYLSYVSTVAPCLGTATPPQAHASTLVDGTFLTESKCYQLGSVYWNSLNPGNSVDINLGSGFLISSAIVQADDNDTYTLQYRDTAGVYHDWWHIPTAGTVGSTTRPNSNQTQRQNLAAVLATGLRFFAPPSSGDGEYAVSEFKPLACPSTWLTSAPTLLTRSLREHPEAVRRVGFAPAILRPDLPRTPQPRPNTRQALHSRPALSAPLFSGVQAPFGKTRL